MGQRTGITWCDHTLNWWWGCTEVTEECDNCYAKEWAARLRGMSWGDDALRIKIKSAPGDLRKWDKKARAVGEMRRVFAHSMSDVFDIKIDNVWRDELFTAMRFTTNLWFLVLTKRPSLACRYEYPFEKIWLGTSIGQEKNINMAYKIIEAPARLHWISYEPAIGALPIHRLPSEIKWVVIGGESGINARPFQIEWAYETIDSCRESGISCFVKQLGAKPFYKGKPFNITDSHGKILNEWPEGLRVQEYPL